MQCDNASAVRCVVFVCSLPDAPPLTGTLSPNFAESIADAELLFADVLNGAECLEWDEMGTLVVSGYRKKAGLVFRSRERLCHVRYESPLFSLIGVGTGS